MNADVYAQLARALDRLPGGFPQTESRVELQILRKIFSPKEALVASNMTGTSEAVDVIAERASLPIEEIEERLKGILGRGIIWGSEREGIRKFRLAPFIVGIYESQWDVMDHELFHLFERYWNEGGAVGIMRYEPALHRVVPAQRALRLSFTASLGQPVTQRPQPMHFVRSITETSSSTEQAATWQRSSHVPQPAHSSGSTTAK
ncbi:hypothetical protein ES703_51521 [subsurface metagenome]